MAVDVLTFGCRLNAFESELMRDRAAEAGLDDAILVNTCAVTAEAVRQARQSIRKARREHPGRPIVVSGCAAQIAPERFAAMAEVDLVLGNADKLTADSYRPIPSVGTADDSSKIRVNDIFGVRENATHAVDGFAASDGLRVRAFVEVQNGCDHRCTFCVIPYGRGNSRSTPMGAVVRQVRRLVENGYREVVLTGIDLTSYGADLPGRPRLGALVRAILRHVPELPRLRLSSIDSVEADAELVRAMAEEDRLMPHLHLSLQSGDDMILKRMKRRHSRADAIEFCETVRRLRPDIVFGADLIAGFPTETDAMFENTLALVEACGLARLHVFPFSPREGTPAARMPQAPRTLIRGRAQRLRDAGDTAYRARLTSEIGKTRHVLVEKEGFGRSEHDLPVAFEGGHRGAIIAIRVLESAAKALNGQAILDAA